MFAESQSIKNGTKHLLKEIAKQATVLAAGLQNAAPPQANGPSKSVLYLTETAAQIEELCRSIEGPSSISSSEE